MKYLLPLLLAACGPIPVQIEKTSMDQKQSQEQNQSSSQQASTSSEGRQGQGTVSQPIINVCVQANAASARNVYCQPAPGELMENNALKAGDFKGDASRPIPGATKRRNQ